MSSTNATGTSDAKKVGAFGRIGRSFKGMRGEMKRVVWPSRKQVLNNTGIVLIFMVLAGILIGAFDMLLSALIRLFFGA